MRREYWNVLRDVTEYQWICWPTYVWGLIKTLQNTELNQCCNNHAICSGCSIDYKLPTLVNELPIPVPK